MVFIKLKSSAHDTTVDDKVGPNVVLNGLDKLSRDEKAGLYFTIFWRERLDEGALFCLPLKGAIEISASKSR